MRQIGRADNTRKETIGLQREREREREMFEKVSNGVFGKQKYSKKRTFDGRIWQTRSDEKE
jgi:hypothetical protein